VDLQLRWFPQPQIFLLAIVLHNNCVPLHYLEHDRLGEGGNRPTDALCSNVLAALWGDTRMLPWSSSLSFFHLPHLAADESDDNHRILREVDEEEWVRFFSLQSWVYEEPQSCPG